MNMYRFDADFDRPWEFADLQDLLHSLSWPIVTGFILGFGLAIFLFIADVKSSTNPVKKSPGFLVNSEERSL